MMQSANSTLKSSSPNQCFRQCLVLAGNPAWAINTARKLLQNSADYYWVSDKPQTGICNGVLLSNYHSLLGRETQYLVYDANGCFNIDAFGLTSGIVRGGGYIILLTPIFELWPDQTDKETYRLFGQKQLPHSSLFIQRIINILKADTCVHILNENSDKKFTIKKNIQPNKHSQYEQIYDSGALTKDQDNIVSIITKTIRQKQKCSFIVTAHRGRGKTAALGLIAANLLNSGRSKYKILCTAPRLSALTPLFDCAEIQLNRNHHNTKKTTDKLNAELGCISFVAIDALTLNLPQADVVFVDESAGIPVPLLDQLSQNYSRIIFSGTTHGYEGTGRGFSLRFIPSLQKSNPKVKHLKIVAPVRWQDKDPAEKLISSMLGLEFTIATDSMAKSAYHSKVRCITLSQSQINSDSDVLAQFFGLLVLSHYQTKPSDLRVILDSTDIKLFAIVSRTSNGKTIVLGAAIVFYEGSISQQLHQDIFLGKRRLRNQFLPQAIATQSNTEEILALKGARIQRIAIHPAIHRKGLGSLLLSEINRLLKLDNIDYTGSSFGTTEDLLSFWLDNGFCLAAVGSKRDASSGCHSALVVQGLSGKGKLICEKASHFNQNNLSYMLKTALKDIDRGLHTLLKSICSLDTQKSQFKFTSFDYKGIHSYAFGFRHYDYLQFLLYNFVSFHMKSNKIPKELNALSRNILEKKILENLSWKICIKQLNLKGMKEADNLLRQAIGQLLSRQDLSC